MSESTGVRVSVVIPVRNGAATIEDQLEALEGQAFDGPWELVVADNGSTDGTREVVERFRERLPQLRIVPADHGVGINVGRNAGVREAVGELILICDADDVVRPGWIAAHVENLARFEISGGPVDEQTMNTPEVVAFNSHRSPGDDLPVSGRFLPYAFGGNCGFHRSVWEAIGGFNDAWQRGSTEVEFFWRAQLAGYSVGWAPGAVLDYRHEDSIRSEIRRRYRYARAMPRLYANFKRHGMPGRPLRPALKAWVWLAVRAPRAAVDSEFRMKWVQVAAWRGGLLAGSLRYRALYL